MNPIIDTFYGKIQGFEAEGVYKYFGIPYAKPPVGELRFREAQEPECWQGVREAIKAAPNPPQTEGDNSSKMNENTEYFSEDCLYLNVWTPKEGKNLPVMVWIPGGGFITGGAGIGFRDGMANKEPTEQGTRFARDENVIMVSFSYRVGALGWMNFDKYSERFDRHIGMKDAIAALKWVNKCIGAFGGDPNNVTIFGVSAGGTLTTTLLMTPAAWPYYKRAIAHSSLAESVFTEAEHDEAVRLFIEKIGLTPDTVYKIADAPLEEIYEAAAAVQGFIFRTYFPTTVQGPMVDGEFILTMPSLCNVPQFDKSFMIGNCSREGDFYTKDYPWGVNKMSRYENSLRAFRNFPPDIRRKVRAEYDFLSSEGFSDILTDFMYEAPKLQLAEQVCEQVDVYVFNNGYSTKSMQEFGYNACHSSDLYPLFDKTEGNMYELPISRVREGCEEEFEAVGVQLRKLWASFARTGKPESDMGDEWKPYDKKKRWTMVLPETKLVSDYEMDVRLRFKAVKPICHSFGEYENNPWAKR